MAGAESMQAVETGRLKAECQDGPRVCSGHGLGNTDGQPSSAQSELCCEARKQPLLLCFIKKKTKPEDVTGGRAIVREIIISPGPENLSQEPLLLQTASICSGISY